jgi:hypothetical protein
MGRILDGIADYVVSIFIYIGIGFGFAMRSTDPAFYWFLILAAAVSNALHSAILDYHRNKYMDYALNRESTLGTNLQAFRKKYKELRYRKGHTAEKIILWIYIKYSNLQLKMSRSNIETNYQLYDKEYFLRRHKPIMHLWTYIGPTTELSFLIICAFIGRLDIFLWGMVTVANIYVLLLLLIQKKY